MAGSDNVLYPLIEVRTPAQKAKPGHSGIDLNVNPELRAQSYTLFRIFYSLGKTGYRLRQLLGDQRLRVLPRRMAQNQNRHTDAPFSQLQRLIETRDGQIVRPFLLKQPCHSSCAMAIGVSLHNAEKAASAWQMSPYFLVIVFDVIKADLSPCSLMQLFHINTS